MSIFRPSENYETFKKRLYVYILEGFNMDTKILLNEDYRENLLRSYRPLQGPEQPQTASQLVEELNLFGDLRLL